MTIPQPVINTFKRVGIDYSDSDSEVKTAVTNRFTGESVQTHPLVARCINWVYRTSNSFESEFDHRGGKLPTISDFDRVRYWIAKVDSDAYMTCID
jgi:hypothetical protein